MAGYNCLLSRSSVRQFQTDQRIKLPFFLSFRKYQDIPDGRLRMRNRQQILERYCSTKRNEDLDSPDDSGGEPLFRSNSLVSRQRRLLYCPVGKAASTLLTRFLVSALETDPVVSPYAISIQKALRMREKRSGNGVLFTPLNKLAAATGGQEKRFLESLTRVLFVRCPFRRLWSAYVDKLVLPNPNYWQAWGRPAMNGSQARSAATDGDGDGDDDGESQRVWPGEAEPAEAAREECGQSVTFSQFLRFVLSDLHLRDAHVRPVARECAPCYVNYDVIGHVETLASDVLHLTRLLRWNDSALRTVRWREEWASDAIKDGVRNVFDKWRPPIARCMSMEEAGRRLWRVSQIRGVIGEREQYPFAGSGARPLAAAAVERALLEARYRSRGQGEELARQENSAFRAAYGAIGAELKKAIRKVYRADFQMFGFDVLLHL